MRSLRTRVTVAVVAVAVLAVLVTAILAVQLVRTSTNTEARQQLARQADAIASQSDLAEGDPIWSTLGDTRYAIVSPGGRVTGSAVGIVDPVLLARLKATDSISTSRRDAGQFYLVEARRAVSGEAIVLALPQERVEKTVRDATWRIVLALVIGVLVALAAGALLSGWLTRSLRRVASSARRMSRGERGVTTAVTSPSEVAAIADALASLDGALATSEGRQREFLLSISHEMRTPLTAVRGYAEALADGMIAPEDLAAVGATLVTETERIDRFIADLLELARLESDDFTIDPKPIQLAEVLTAVALAWAAHASRLGVRLTVGGDCTVTTDAQRVRQLIDGLVENALRVTPEGGEVAVTVRVDDAVLIEVADGGPGLSSEDKAVAFERGVLRSRYRDIRPVGTGLGLSIAARLAGRLGGTIRVGDAPGGGAIFTVALPKD